MKKKKITYSMRKSLCGYAFISVWLVGTVIFFLIPLFRSVLFSFSEVSIESGKTLTEYVGIAKYAKVLTEDEKYTEYLENTLFETLWKTPVIIVFSLFVSVILNQKFRGRTLARAVFFLPVIISTGYAYRIINDDIKTSGNDDFSGFSTLFSTDFVGEFFEFSGIYGISENAEKMFSAVADNIFGIVWNSGIQIMIFLSALQSIPKSSREVAEIEGATAWEYFWKVTFPYILPFISANTVFTVIDTFTNPMNPVMERIADMRNQWAYGEAAAMAWIYFVIVMSAVGLVTLIFRKSSTA